MPASFKVQVLWTLHPTSSTQLGDLQAVTPGNVMIKFADDAYLIIPAANANSRQPELDSVELRSRANNLKVNPTRYTEITFVHNKL